ncbi:MAG: GatB/YqeY domain-containing protein [Desulfobacteraceae bacterium]|nr:GatB/YqeY domain-containing protein [Desulfobacteraceae bacterium]
MELQQRIETALKEAMREKSEVKRDALRMLLTALKLKEKEIKRAPSEAETQQVIATLIKQRRDSAGQYRTGGREDLATKEESEILILQGFLPEQLSAGELEKIVADSVAEAGASSPKEMGKVMKILMPKIAGRADGKTVNDLVRRKLGG